MMTEEGNASTLVTSWGSASLENQSSLLLPSAQDDHGNDNNMPGTKKQLPLEDIRRRVVQQVTRGQKTLYEPIVPSSLYEDEEMGQSSSTNSNGEDVLRQPQHIEASPTTASLPHEHQHTTARNTSKQNGADEFDDDEYWQELATAAGIAGGCLGLVTGGFWLSMACGTGCMYAVQDERETRLGTAAVRSGQCVLSLKSLIRRQFSFVTDLCSTTTTMDRGGHVDTPTVTKEKASASIPLGKAKKLNRISCDSEGTVWLTVNNTREDKDGSIQIAAQQPDEMQENEEDLVVSFDFTKKAAETTSADDIEMAPLSHTHATPPSPKPAAGTPPLPPMLSNMWCQPLSTANASSADTSAPEVMPTQTTPVTPSPQAMPNNMWCQPISGGVPLPNAISTSTETKNVLTPMTDGMWCQPIGVSQENVATSTEEHTSASVPSVPPPSVAANAMWCLPVSPLEVDEEEALKDRGGKAAIHIVEEDVKTESTSSVGSSDDEEISPASTDVSPVKDLESLEWCVPVGSVYE